MMKKIKNTQFYKDLYNTLILSFALLFTIHFIDHWVSDNYKTTIKVLFLFIVALLYSPFNAAVSFLLIFIFDLLISILPSLVIVEAHLILFFIGITLNYSNIYYDITLKINSKEQIAETFKNALRLFLLMTVVSITLGVVGFLLNIENNVAERISGMPPYILLFAVFFAPISEEIFFRGFLVRKVGVFLSSLLFSVAHLFYGSLYELVGTFFIGYLLADNYAKNKNLASCIFAHSIFNLVSIGFMLIGRGVM